MTFVCVEAAPSWVKDVYVWWTGYGHVFARIEDHRRFAIAKIWNRYGESLARADVARKEQR